MNFSVLKRWKCPDPDTGADLARDIRRFFIPDFSNWKDHDSFEKTFSQLLRDLQEETPNPAEPSPRTSRGKKPG
jgi:hypothetical protein